MRRIDWMVWVSFAGLFLAVTPQAVAAECVIANTGGVQLTGTLDALRGGLRALIVRPVAPVCLTGPAPADAVSATDAVQVYSDTDAVMTTMMSLMGREVQLTGRMYAPFAQLHRAPIVMEVVAVEIK